MSEVMSQFCESNFQRLNYDSGQKYEFGNFQDTNNWIECTSIRFPGKTYFFNVRTLRSTWIRPISKHVQLQRFNKQSRVHDNTCTSDVHDSLIIMSSENEKTDDDCNGSEKIIKKKQRNKRTNLEVVASWYNGTNSRDFTNNYDKYFDDNFSCISKDLYAKSNYSKLHNCLTESNNLEEKKIHKCSDSPITTSDFLDTKLCVLKDEFITTEKSERSMSKDISVKENSIAHTSNEKRENDIVKNCSTLNLKKLTPLCLLKNKQQKRKEKNVKKQTVQKETKLRTTKIICEMYGTKTINYDFVEPDLPPGVKTTNLSDSSVTSSLWKTENIKPVNSSNFDIPNFNSHVNLSSESSFSSSTSTCSCCSTSSDTSSSSTNFTGFSKRG